MKPEKMSTIKIIKFNNKTIKEQIPQCVSASCVWSFGFRTNICRQSCPCRSLYKTAPHICLGPCSPSVIGYISAHCIFKRSVIFISCSSVKAADCSWSLVLFPWILSFFDTSFFRDLLYLCILLGWHQWNHPPLK